MGTTFQHCSIGGHIQSHIMDESKKKWGKRETGSHVLNVKGILICQTVMGIIGLGHFVIPLAA